MDWYSHPVGPARIISAGRNSSAINCIGFEISKLPTTMYFGKKSTSRKKSYRLWQTNVEPNSYLNTSFCLEQWYPRISFLNCRVFVASDFVYQSLSKIFCFVCFWITLYCRHIKKTHTKKNNLHIGNDAKKYNNDNYDDKCFFFALKLFLVSTCRNLIFLKINIQYKQILICSWSSLILPGQCWYRS